MVVAVLITMINDGEPLLMMVNDYDGVFLITIDDG